MIKTFKYMPFLNCLMAKKRAVGLSIETIIIAALGFVVLVIVAVIVRTQLGHYSKGYKDTADNAIKSAEGKCISSPFSATTKKCSKDDLSSAGWKQVEGKCDKVDEKCYEKT